MNWLILPHTGKVNVRGESNFILFEDMAREFINRGDFVYFCVPDWTKEEDMKLPRDKVIYIKLPLTGAYYVDMLVAGQELVRRFNRKLGSSFVDCVITSKPFLTPFLAVGLSDTQRSDVPVQYFEPGVDIKYDQLKRPTGIDESAWYLIDGAYITGYPIFLTETERDSARNFMKAHIQGKQVIKSLEERSTIIPVGLPKDILDVHKGTPKNEQFTLFFGARVNNQKRADEVVELYNRFYESGRDVKIIVCTSTPEMLAKRYIGKEKLIENPNIELHTDMGREGYLKLAAKSHVFVAHSKIEGFPIGFWEQMYLDIIGVFVNEKWVRAQIPSEYPFQYNDIPEAYGILCWIYDHYEEAKKKLEPMKELADTFDKERIYKQVWQRGHDLKDGKHQYRITTGTQELLDIIEPELPERFSFQDVLELMHKRGRHFPIANIERSRTYFYASDYDLFRYFSGKYDYEIDPKEDMAWFSRKSAE